jgi:hypothetical protein
MVSLQLHRRRCRHMQNCCLVAHCPTTLDICGAKNNNPTLCTTADPLQSCNAWLPLLNLLFQVTPKKKQGSSKARMTQALHYFPT